MPKKKWSGLFKKRQAPAWLVSASDLIIHLVQWLWPKLSFAIERGGDLDFLIKLDYTQVLAWLNHNRWWIFPIIGFAWLYRNLPDQEESDRPLPDTDDEENDESASPAPVGIRHATPTVQGESSVTRKAEIELSVVKETGGRNTVVLGILNLGQTSRFKAACRFSESSVEGLAELKTKRIGLAGDLNGVLITQGGHRSKKLLWSAVGRTSSTVALALGTGDPTLLPARGGSVAFTLTLQIWIDEGWSFTRKDRITVNPEGASIVEIEPTVLLRPGVSAWESASATATDDDSKRMIIELADEIMAFYKARQNEGPSALMQAATRLASPGEPSYDETTVIIFKQTYGVRIHAARDVFKAAGLDTSGLDVHDAMRAERVYGFGYTLKHRASKL